MSEARDHAVAASEMIRSLERLGERIDRMTPDEIAQALVSGGFTRINADQAFTVQLATANALAAIALVLTREDE